jgi:hypothetical protein
MHGRLFFLTKCNTATYDGAFNSHIQWISPTQVYSSDRSTHMTGFMLLVPLWEHKPDRHSLAIIGHYWNPKQ